MKCFYHSADLDGKCSGAIVKQVYPECEMIGINYGEEFPWGDLVLNETVFMVDFSLQPFSDMFRLNEITNLVWIDHHISAIEEANKNNFFAYRQILVNDMAACESVWNYFYSSIPIPKVVHLLGRYDVWDLIDGTLELQNGMRLNDTSPENQKFWGNLFSNDVAVDDLIQTGAILLKKQNIDNELHAKSCAFETELDGLKVIAMNTNFLSSIAFKSVWDSDKYDAMLAFIFRKKFWSVSLYTDKDGIDVSKVCKARGGGGHKQAAGFQCNELPFLKNQ